jgi:type III pantothenate kinase
MIVFDIGNTNTDYAVVRDGKLSHQQQVNNSQLNKHYIQNLCQRYKPQYLLISSVAPSLTAFFRGVKPQVKLVGRDIKIPLSSKYDHKDIGQDRLVTAFAVKKYYPQVRIVVDFGTATTVDFLSKKGDYLGGLILPGVNLYLDSLKKCELLPDKIKIKPISATYIPKNTQDSISAGLIEGFAAMINGIIAKYRKFLRKQQKQQPRVIITGGGFSLMRKKLDFSHIYDKDLALKGLALLAKNLENPT